MDGIKKTVLNWRLKIASGTQIEQDHGTGTNSASNPQIFICLYHIRATCSSSVLSRHFSWKFGQNMEMCHVIFDLKFIWGSNQSRDKVRDQNWTETIVEGPLLYLAWEKYLITCMGPQFPCGVLDNLLEKVFVFYALSTFMAKQEDSLSLFFFTLPTFPPFFKKFFSFGFEFLVWYSLSYVRAY